MPTKPSPPDTAVTEPNAALVGALARLLRPLVRLLVANGITYPFLANLLKSTYVGVASEHFTIANKSLTDSRVSLLTGVHRKDVRRLRSSDDADSAPTKGTSLGTQVVARWLGAAPYVDSRGAPRRLPRTAQADTPSFDSLVAEVSRRNVRARSVLDELQRLGIVSLDATDQVSLDVEGYVPDTGFDEKAYYFGRILASHIDTAAHNLATAGDRPFMDRAVFYDGLDEDDVAKLEAMCRELGGDALKRVNAEALKMQRRARNRTGTARRICFGVFFHDAPGQRDDKD